MLHNHKPWTTRVLTVSPVVYHGRGARMYVHPLFSLQFAVCSLIFIFNFNFLFFLLFLRACMPACMRACIPYKASVFSFLSFVLFFTGNMRCTDRRAQAQKTKATMAALICMCGYHHGCYITTTITITITTDPFLTLPMYLTYTTYQYLLVNAYSNSID